MKKYLLVLLAFLGSFQLFAQTGLSCSDLTVQSISLDPLAGLIHLDISNSCVGCASGMNGCVYMEMKLIRTVIPYDTIAASDCYCLVSPDNGALQSYTISSGLTALPPLAEFRVSLVCSGYGCDTIPFSATLGTPEISKPVELVFYPNPTSEFVYIQARPGEGMILHVTDAAGREVVAKLVKQESEWLHVAHLKAGQYVISLKDRRGVITKTGKLIRE